MRPNRASQRAIQSADTFALLPLAVFAASTARRSSTTAGPIRFVSGNLSPLILPIARPGEPGTLVPGGGMKCGGKSICVPVCSVIWYALTAAMPFFARPR
jgi:hypothetical protein